MFMRLSSASMFDLRRGGPRIRIFGIQSNTIDIRIDLAVAIHTAWLSGKEIGDSRPRINSFAGLRVSEWTDLTLTAGWSWGDGDGCNKNNDQLRPYKLELITIHACLHSAPGANLRISDG